MKIDQRTIMVIGLGAIAGYVFLTLTQRAASAAVSGVQSAVTGTLQAINPVNQDNIFYSGVNAIGSKLTGDQQFNLGGWIYDNTHFDQHTF